MPPTAVWPGHGKWELPKSEEKMGVGEGEGVPHHLGQKS